MDVIKYQCSYCNTLFDSTEHCPTCGALSKDATQINYTQNVKKRKKELAIDTYFYPIYKLFCSVHLFTCISWFGLWMSIPTTILHLIYIFVIRKKKSTNSQSKSSHPSQKRSILFHILTILDMVLCVPSFLAMIALFFSLFIF